MFVLLFLIFSLPYQFSPLQTLKITDLKLAKIKGENYLLIFHNHQAFTFPFNLRFNLKAKFANKFLVETMLLDCLLDKNDDNNTVFCALPNFYRHTNKVHYDMKVRLRYNYMMNARYYLFFRQRAPTKD